MNEPIIRPLEPANAGEYRGVMLQAYATEPDTFTSTVAERELLPLSWWAARISDPESPGDVVYGAFVDERLVGVAGLRSERRPRTRHKASLFGMYVLPEFRGRGLARRLVQAVIQHARATPGTLVVQLTVTQSNVPAIRLYESCGFVPFGTEPFAVKRSKGFLSKVHMWRKVGQDAA